MGVYSNSNNFTLNARLNVIYSCIDMHIHILLVFDSHKSQLLSKSYK